MSTGAGLMAGKRGLIMGVANDRSIAWGIAKAVHAQGGQCAFTYLGEALERRVRPLAAEVGTPDSLILPCDVAELASIESSSETSQGRIKLSGVPTSAASGRTRFSRASP